MADETDSDAEFSDDDMPPEGASDEVFLSELDDESAHATPEFELLNDVTQHYLNEIGAVNHYSRPMKSTIGRAVRKSGRVRCTAKHDRARTAARREYRQALPELWHSPPGSDCSTRPDSAIEKFDPGSRVPFFDVRDLVDSPEYRTFNHESVAN